MVNIVIVYPKKLIGDFVPLTFAVLMVFSYQIFDTVYMDEVELLGATRNQVQHIERNGNQSRCASTCSVPLVSVLHFRSILVRRCWFGVRGFRR